MTTLIKNAKIVTENKVIEDKNLVITDGIITGIFDACDGADRVIDAEGDWLVPGFIDIHCHGGGGSEFMDGTLADIKAIEDFHLNKGTTTMLATTLAASDTEIERAIQAIDAYISNNKDSIIAGIHLEGPWFNPAECGAQNPEYIKVPTLGQLSELKAKYPSILRVSAAPEIPGGLELGDEGVKSEIIMSCAHTSAKFSEISRAISHGYTLMTHLYSGMRGVWRENSYRIAGAVEAGLYYDEMYVELISDNRHLPEELLRFVYKIKGADRICLITDAIRAAGLPNGSETVIGSYENGLKVVVEDDVAKLPDRQSFAGSTATMDRQFFNMLKAVDFNIVDAVKMASTTPARLLRLTDRGEIACGKRADLLLLNINEEKIVIKKIIKGETLK